MSRLAFTLAIRCISIGAALYALLFFAAACQYAVLGRELYEQLHLAESWTVPLAIAGLFLFPGLLLGEVLFQSARHRP